MRKIYLFIVIILLLPSLVFAATTYNVACSGTITDALDTAISSAVDSDTVAIGAGSCSTAGNIIINKAITIQGAGQASTTLTTTSDYAFIFRKTSSAHSAWRVTAMTVTGTSPNGVMRVNDNSLYENSGSDLWRVDHVTFSFASYSGTLIQVNGPSWGLVDNNIFNSGGGLVVNTHGEYVGESDDNTDNLKGNYISSLALEPGSVNAVYIEDNTFSCPTVTGCAVIDTSNVGERIVFRHNTVTNGMLYVHWTRTADINGFWFEVYNNKMSWSGSDMFPARFEAGTGLVYNNTLTGYDSAYMVLDERRGAGDETNAPLLSCNGARTWDGNAGDASAPGWPCLGQIGRATGKTLVQIKAGTKQTSFPFYSWNNGTQDKCYNSSAEGAACVNSINFSSWTANYVKGTAHSVTGEGYGHGDIDFCSGGTSIPAGCGTHTLTYTPYIYPHPLQGADATAPTISGLTPSGTISYQTTTQLSATTNENSTCRYHASSTTWGDMTQMSSTGFLTHLQTVNVSVGANSFKIVCQDGTANESDAGTWSFTVSAAPATPPAGTFAIGTGGSITKGSGGSITRQAP